MNPLYALYVLLCSYQPLYSWIMAVVRAVAPFTNMDK